MTLVDHDDIVSGMTATEDRTDTWLSIPEAAEYLGVHARTLRRYIRDGKLPVLRLSNQVVRITAKDMQRFLDANVKVTTGTGTCYVPDIRKPVRKVRKAPAPAAPAVFSG